MRDNDHVSDFECLADFFRTEIEAFSSLDAKLRIAEVYGRLLWLNITGTFEAEDVELLVYERVRSSLLSKYTGAPNPPSRPNAFLHVVSELYDVGGHSRLVLDLIEGLFGSHAGTRQNLVATRHCSHGSKQKIDDLGAGLMVLSGHPSQKIRALVKAAADVNVVVLATHPDDIVAVMAARHLRENGKTVLFVNHADHVFSYGPGAATAVLEIGGAGSTLSRARRRPQAQSFLGIPFPIRQAEQQTYVNIRRNGPILAVGRGDKFAPRPDYNFPNFLKKLLQLVDNDVVLIGPKIEDGYWNEVIQEFPERISLLGMQPRAVVSEYLKSASCYVDSFPLDGGTIFTEALLAGLPVFGLNRAAAAGVSPVDALRCNSEEQLVVQVSSFLADRGDFDTEPLENVRKQIVLDHSLEAITDRLLMAARGECCPTEKYERIAGRDLTYNSAEWRRAGPLKVPRRIAQGLSTGERFRLLAHASRLIRSGSLRRKTLMRLVANIVYK